MIVFRYFDGKNLVDCEADSVSELKWIVHKMKKEFCKQNCCKPDDRMFKSYCDGLDRIVKDTVSKHLKDDAVCKECLPEDHENEFCRCESRNMRIARLNRQAFKDNKGQGNNETLCCL
jgi:hypothetical protein